LLLSDQIGINEMDYFILRNTTIEPFFSDFEASFSGYDDISIVPENAKSFIWFYIIPLKSDIQLLTDEIAAYYTNFEFVINKIPPFKTCYIFTLTPLLINIVETGNFLVQESVNNFNTHILRLSEKHRNIKIIDFQSFTSNYPLQYLIDWKYYYLSKAVLNPKLAGQFKTWFTQQLDAIQMKRKKCLILDLDNTLWGGILGEDGIYGVKVGGGYPGNAFHDFQRSILELHKAGIILTICSKNNESDVLEAWERNPNILIRKEHLATYRINWNNKAQNISEILVELNIGADSVVFLDDNPAERKLVNHFYPMIETPEFPSQPYMLSSFIKEVTEKYFRIYQLTSEDKIKTLQYQENVIRAEFRKKFSDLTDYLTSLEIKIILQPATELSIPRIAQLTQKTNQFNLTAKRYTEADIRAFIELRHWVYTIAINDRFGDHGITGSIIITIDHENRSAIIDTLLLSCRVLGKGIEEAFLNAMLNKLKESGIYLVYGTYIKTAKNEQVKDYYSRIGFVPDIRSGMNNEEFNYYKLNLSDKEFEVKPFYKVINGKN
jgi:FkbH-like protein